MGVSMSTVQALRHQGYEAVHLREQKLERLPDPDILEKAKREHRIIITFDLDFGDLLAAGGPSSSKCDHLPFARPNSSLGDAEAA